MSVFVSPPEKKSCNSVSKQDQVGLQAIMVLEPDLGSLRDRITPGPQDPRNVQTPLVVCSPLMKQN